MGLGPLLLLRGFAGEGVAFRGGVGSSARRRCGAGAGLAGVLVTEAYEGFGLGDSAGAGWGMAGVVVGPSAAGGV